MQTRDRQITYVDLRRLEALVGVADAQPTLDGSSLERLAEQIGEAELVAPQDVAEDVVTMGSMLEVTDLDTGERFGVSVVFPRQADAWSRRISVLAPLGMAVLGRRVGDVVEWQAPRGQRRLRVENVVSQPEREGRDLD